MLVFLTRVIYLYISKIAALTVHIQRAHCNFKLPIFTSNIFSHNDSSESSSLNLEFFRIFFKFRISYKNKPEIDIYFIIFITNYRVLRNTDTQTKLHRSLSYPFFFFILSLSKVRWVALVVLSAH